MYEFKLTAKSLSCLKEFPANKKAKFDIYGEIFEVHSLFPTFVSNYLTQYLEEEDVFIIDDKQNNKDLMIQAFKLILELFYGNEIGPQNIEMTHTLITLSKIFKSDHLERYFSSPNENRSIFPIFTFSGAGQFTFKIGSETITCSEIEASILSEKAKRLILDEKVNELTLKSEPFRADELSSAFHAFHDTLSGIPITYSDTSSRIFCFLAEQLQNDELLDFFSIKADYYAANFTTIPKENLLSLDTIILESILTSPKLSAPSQNNLLLFLLDYAQIHGPSSYYLIDYVNLNDVDPQLLIKAFTTVSFSFQTQLFFTSLFERQNQKLSSLKSKAKHNKSLKKKYGQQNELIQALTNENSGLKSTLYKGNEYSVPLESFGNFIKQPGWEAQTHIFNLSQHAEDYKESKGWLLTFFEQLTLDHFVILLEECNEQDFQTLAYNIRYKNSLDYPNEIQYYLMGLDENGDMRGTILLGLIYLRGTSIPQDKKKAFELLNKAKDKGNLDAYCFLGECYQFGYSVPTNNKKAFELYSFAAESNSLGMWRVGACYKDGIGIRKDEKKAFEYFYMAAKQGLSLGYIDVGFCFDKGIGTQQDYAKAFKYYKKASKVGSPLGLYNVGVFYENGYGVPVDKKKAFGLYDKAAKAGNQKGRNAVIRFYENGII